VAEAADLLDCSLVLTMGALLSDVPHTRPTTVSGTADDDDLIEQLGLVRSTYEGPTGIVGVLHTTLPAARRAVCVAVGGRAHLRVGRPVAEGDPRPRGAGAPLLGLHSPTTDLQIATAAYERQIDELVEADEDTAAYVASLEEAADEEP
jgi:hypothetical protein